MAVVMIEVEERVSGQGSMTAQTKELKKKSDKQAHRGINTENPVVNML